MLSYEADRRRKRKRDQASADESQLRTKRRKEGSHHYPPEVWNNLSKVTLTRAALQEFDRRNRESKPRLAVKVPRTNSRLLRSDTRRIARLASNGGPDLSNLRGRADLVDIEDVMSPSNSRTSKKHRNSGRDSGLASGSYTTKTGTTGPYNPQFEQFMIDNGVYPDGYELADGEIPEPGNVEAIRQHLAHSRSSLSPSHFNEESFNQFRRDNRGATSEAKVMSDVIPTIAGNKDRQHYNASNKEFNNLCTFHPELTAPKPDKYYGARPKDIDHRVRIDLDGFIIPSTAKELPAAPNYFMEVKGQSGRLDVLQRQSMYAGLVGAQGMLELQNYANETRVYDGNAYTTVAAYHAGNGTLQMYATHPGRSANGQTEYYMTQLDSYAMTGNINGFRQGAAALRNARDLSKEHRDRFIAGANLSAQSLPTVLTSSSGTGSRTTTSSRLGRGSFDSESSPDELAPEYEEAPKRRRRKTTAGSRLSRSTRNRG